MAMNCLAKPTQRTARTRAPARASVPEPFRALAQQRYAKSHRILANCRGVKDFRRFRNSDQGRFMLSPTGACAWPVPAECRVDKGGKQVGFSNYNSPTSRKARLTGEQVLSVPLLHPEAWNARIILRR